MATTMVHGSPSKHILLFTIPTILGNFFQLAYSTLDAVILGRFAGKNALAAVGAANPMMNIVTFLIVGLCMGASVLMSEFYGANKITRLKHEIATTLITGLLFTIFLSVVGVLSAKYLLMVIATPQEILSEAGDYLRIVFGGLIFTFLYNAYSSALRSIGDSVTPIIFLIVAVVINGVLDAYFVIALGWGVRGTAAATVIAQAISSIACIVYAAKRFPLFRFSKEDRRVDRYLLFRTLNYSWASAMQQTCLYIGKVFIQGAVNPLGVDSIATFNAVSRVDDFAFVPQQSISHSMTVFLAQNRGARRYDRIKKGFRSGMLFELIYWLMLGSCVFCTASHIMRLFVSQGDESVVLLGVEYLQIMAIFYFMPGLTNAFQGYFRGMGRMQVTLGATALQITVRALCSYLFAPSFGITGIAFACIIGWIVMVTYEIIMYLFSLKRDYPNNMKGKEKA